MFFTLLGLVIGYLCGSLNGALIASIFKGSDIRTKGSKNAGATNVLRVFGVKWAIAVLLFDMLKAIIPMLLWRSQALPIGIAAIVGHTFPLYFKFKGGKGVITSAAVFLILNPLVGAITIVIALLVIILTKYVSLGSIIGALTLPISAFFLSNDTAYKILCTVACILVIYLHRGNIKRLISGTERKLNGG